MKRMWKSKSVKPAAIFDGHSLKIFKTDFFNANADVLRAKNDTFCTQKQVCRIEEKSNIRLRVLICTFLYNSVQVLNMYKYSCFSQECQCCCLKEHLLHEVNNRGFKK